jgi:hypothetical protein
MTHTISDGATSLTLTYDSEHARDHAMNSQGSNTKWRRKGGAAAILLALLLIGRSNALPSVGTDGSTAEQNESAVLKYLGPALRVSGNVARLNFITTSCESGEAASIEFPELNVSQPPKDKAGLELIRGIFQNNGNITVVEQPRGVVRITVGDVPEEILHTKIRNLALTPREQFNPEEALDAIENTKEMDAGMRKLGFRLAEALADHPVESPKAGHPHLPPLMRNVTVDEALNSIAETFQGIVLFGACKQSKVLDMGFAGIGLRSRSNPGQ